MSVRAIKIRLTERGGCLGCSKASCIYYGKQAHPDSEVAGKHRPYGCNSLSK
jgi:hypothetical protein